MANHFSPEVANDLLEKLSTDDAFRDLFYKNPRAAFEKVGHVTPEQDRDIRGADPVLCAYNLGPGGLASKEAIRAGHLSMKTALTSTQSQTVFKA